MKWRRFWRALNYVAILATLIAFVLLFIPAPPDPEPCNRLRLEATMEETVLARLTRAVANSRSALNEKANRVAQYDRQIERNTARNLSYLVNDYEQRRSPYLKEIEELRGSILQDQKSLEESKTRLDVLKNEILDRSC